MNHCMLKSNHEIDVVKSYSNCRLFIVAKAQISSRASSGSGTIEFRRNKTYHPLVVMKWIQIMIEVNWADPEDEIDDEPMSAYVRLN